VDAIGAHPAHATFDQARPHAAVDHACIATFDNQRPERTGCRRQFGLVAVERDDRGLKAEHAKRVAHLLEPRRDTSRPLQAGSGGQLAAEFRARLAERFGPSSYGNSLSEEGNQLGQAPVRELDSLELGRDAVDLRRPSGARSAPAAAPLGRNREESGLDQPVEAAASDVPMNAEYHGNIIGRKWIAAAACVEKDPAKLGIAGRCEAVERHSRERYPAAARVGLAFPA
jgi:hypothetical protein